jgi:hypothetical protein
MKKEIKKIITKLIRVESRTEALEILDKASVEQVNEFFDYWNKGGQENVCCLVLDSIKIDLVKSGKMVKGENDSFGKINFLEL